MKTILKEDFPNKDFKVGDLVKGQNKTIIKVTSLYGDNMFSGIVLYSESRSEDHFQEESGWAIIKFEKFNGELIFKN